MKKGAVVLFFFLYGGMALGRQEKVLDYDGKVSIIADKIYRNSDEIIVTTGNVIVRRGSETLYYEVGFFDEKKDLIEAEGKVRLTTPEFSMHGSKFTYSLTDRSLKVHNSQIFAPTFSLLSDYLERVEGDIIIASHGEYSNCKDCPESWSVYGESIKVVPDEYVTINHVVFKVKGTSVAYLPYFVLPIKKNRTTGFLFPNFYRSSLTKGLSMKFPFFWAISPSHDMTIIPSLFGRRGGGGDFEYRSSLGEDKWFRLKTISWMDNQEEPAGGRHLAKYEHHFRWGQFSNHHLSLSVGRDKEIISILDQETRDFYYGNELGMEGFWEWRNDRGQVSLSSYFVDNLITDTPRKFDQSKVHILPRIKGSLQPFYLFRGGTSVLRSALFGGGVELTNFRQWDRNEEPSPYLRDMMRSNINPFVLLEWKRGRWFKLKTQFDGGHQFYRKFEKKRAGAGGNNFHKWGLSSETELALEFGKKYGKSYLKKTPSSQFKEKIFTPSQRGGGEMTIIGSLPSYDSFIGAEENPLGKSSYFHRQEWKVIHYKNLQEGYRGNQFFAEQFSHLGGIFDQYDTFRSNELGILNNRSVYKFSRENVVEIQWNNSVVEKRPLRLTDDFQLGKSIVKNYFSYGKKFHFNVSQGFHLAEEDDQGGLSTGEVLTRLALDTGLKYRGASIESKEYYLYNGRHIYELNLGYQHRRASFLLGFRYNSAIKTAISNTLKLGTALKPLPEIYLAGTYDLKLGSTSGYDGQTYDLIYTPSNRCWSFNAGFSDNGIDQQIEMNFQVLWDKEWL